MHIFNYCKVIGKDDLTELTAYEREKLEEMIVTHGLSDVPLTNLNKDKAIKDLLIAGVLITRTLAMDSFFKGLGCLGIRENTACKPKHF